VSRNSLPLRLISFRIESLWSRNPVRVAPATRTSGTTLPYSPCLHRSHNFLRVVSATRLFSATYFLSTQVGPMRLISVAPTHYAFMLTYILGIRSCLITTIVIRLLDTRTIIQYNGAIGNVYYYQGVYSRSGDSWWLYNMYS